MLDDHDVEVAVGEVGEVCVQGPAVMRGYWQRPEESVAALRNGWLHTGDLGRVDEHGYLYLLDRAKDLIITGGSNVYAVEVEAALVAHPSVQEAAVVGVPDRTWGEVVVAVVVGDQGAQPALTEHCRAALAGYKQPRRYEFVDSQDRTRIAPEPGPVAPGPDRMASRCEPDHFLRLPSSPVTRRWQCLERCRYWPGSLVVTPFRSPFRSLDLTRTPACVKGEQPLRKPRLG